MNIIVTLSSRRHAIAIIRKVAAPLSQDAIDDHNRALAKVGSLNVLVACEFSGVVRRAFEAKGHNAHSCDLLSAEDGCLDRHIQGGILEVLKFIKPGHWDLLIAHPPCTYLCNSGVRWLVPGGKLDKARHKLMQEACDFFAALYHAPIARVCVENPVMHKYARDYLQSAWRVPAHSMTCQPYEHGEPFQKRTCLWLRGLPLLQPTCITKERKQACWLESPGPQRWKNRSRTLPGIARAMASAWGAEPSQSRSDSGADSYK